MSYTDINAKVINGWVKTGWEWSVPIDHDTFLRAQAGDWSVVLTPNKVVPRNWFIPLAQAQVLGLASGGGQQIPIFAAQGAQCTVLDYSEQQLAREVEVAQRERYTVTTVQADMTQSFPFAEACFDLVFHPVSNCYVETVEQIWQECFRVLKPGGVLLAGLDNGINYLFDEAEERVIRKLPHNPLEDPALYAESLEKDWGLQFSHTIEEQIGGQLRAGFVLTDIYHDTNGSGRLKELNAPSFYATRALKPR